MRKASEEMAQGLGREPTVGELTERLDVKVEDVAGALGVGEFYRPASLEEPVESPEGEEATTLADRIGAEDPLLEAAELRIAVRQPLAKLPPQWRDMIRLRYFEGLTQEAVGHRLGVSQMQVSRIERQALTWLQRELRRTRRSEHERAMGAPPAVAP